MILMVVQFKKHVKVCTNGFAVCEYNNGDIEELTIDNYGMVVDSYGMDAVRVISKELI